MNRFHAVLAILGMIASIAQAEIVQINTPMGPFVPGGTATVTWTTDDSPNASSEVQIEAVSRDSSSVLQVANASPNARNVVWKIPNDIGGGTWFLRVNGASSPLFSGDFKVNGKNGSAPSNSSNNNNNNHNDKKPDDKKPANDKKQQQQDNNNNSNAKPSSDRKPAAATGGAGTLSIAAGLASLPVIALAGAQLL
ncbi:hypothetical protein SYNPS1DRAFT_21035 [Syncephalis pseudoplumigaleata]|uniref:Ser-Thr-rich glycosyl-phosphatidyl-inositol-anchored membrane family-domain-containing protein n=1 Tax=Syncephalis pseudoplumigaleata TaxID=1712513 RepID=A0A4P9Z6G1_9FUNG|nr:hypothetical protein SYNPS1DRAFT_21035 [Syncephalis pseudoplumigaleata]|eukprot:RKP27431.1 hypothetical protein SYNPS1DRAFT_21035 [Syncephalis pseudoplumigaleata]